MASAVFTSPANTGMTYKVTRGTITNTALENILGGAATIHSITLDNDANGSQINFVKFYNQTSVTAGTTPPDIVLKCDADEKNITFEIPGGITFNTGVSIYATSSSGGTAGTSAPGSDLTYYIVHT